MLEKKSKALLKGVENRDEQAFAHLFDKEAPLVAARLRVRGAGSGDVEDILQETFLTVWEKAGSYRGEGPVAAWIWTIARNKWVSRIRAQSRTGFYRSNEQGLIDFDDPGMKIDMEESLKALPISMREVMVAVAIRGLTTEEAADELGVPVGTVKSRLHRARARLKEELG